MITLRLHRTHILKDYIKGYLTIDGTDFSCFTLEATEIGDHNPINPIFKYALPKGTYKIVLMPYKFYPLFPYFCHKPYINLSFIEQEGMTVRPGCIAVGSKFVGSRTLYGFEKVAEAFRTLIYQSFIEWKESAILVIDDDDDIQRESEGYTENDDISSDFNFVNL